MIAGRLFPIWLLSKIPEALAQKSDIFSLIDWKYMFLGFIVSF